MQGVGSASDGRSASDGSPATGGTVGCGMPWEESWYATGQFDDKPTHGHSRHRVNSWTAQLAETLA